MKTKIYKQLSFLFIITLFGCTEENYYTCENPLQNLGIVNIYIEGNISTADAQAKIDAELGTLTQNIYIENTTQLTTLSIKLLSNNIRNISVKDNSALETLNIDGNGHNMHTLYIYDTSKMTYLNLKGIKRMDTFDARLLSYPIINNKVISIIDLEILDGFLRFGTNGDNNIFRCPNLKYINYTTDTNYYSASGMTGNYQEVNFSLLEETKRLYFEVGIETFILPKLKECENLEMFFPSPIKKIDNFSFPELTDCFLFSIQGNHSFGNNPTTNPSINIPNLNQCNYLTLSNLGLESNSINNILNKLLNILPISGKTINLELNDSPTGQGLLDKQTLINQGNTVETN